MNADKLLRAQLYAALKATNTPESTHAAVCIATCEPGDPQIEIALIDALRAGR